MMLERRGDVLVITRLPLREMGLLAQGVALSAEGEQVLAALLRGEKVFLLREGLEYRQYRRSAPRGIYQTFCALERRLHEMGIGLMRRHLCLL